MNAGASARPIHDAVFGVGDDSARQEFLAHFATEVAEFERLMTVVYERWQQFERRFAKDHDSATVVGTLFVVVARLLLSTKLLMLGHITLAGAAKRQVFEALAQAYLFSKHGWPYLKQAWDGKFSANKALDLVVKRGVDLNLDSDAVRVISQARDFYNKLSHATILAMGDVVDFDGSRSQLSAPHPSTQRSCRSTVTS